MTAPPMKYVWTDDGFFAPVHPQAAEKHFVGGQVYVLSETRDRSDKSHSQYFAVIQWAWDNLPEDVSAQFPTPEDLRARALIASGYAKSRQFIGSTNKQAVELAAFIGHGRENYAVVSVHENVVTELTAQSQNHKAMGREQFQKSKEAVFEYCAAMCGVSVEDLVKASRVDYAERKKAKAA